MKAKKTIVLLISCLLATASTYGQKYEPEDGKCLVFVGQDLGATGGLPGYEEGYADFFETPAGVTVYTNLSPGGESFGYYQSGLDGLEKKANWGSGDSWAQLYLQDSTYSNSAIAIGLSLVDHERNVAKGKHDELIKELALWIKSTERPVFLRIGYEFDGWDWNHYHKKSYLKSWVRIQSVFEELGVDNVAYVWQSKGWGSDQDVLADWYPGDDRVDWCAYSYFGQPDTEMIAFARKHHKPVFIAEATPVRENDGIFFDTDLKKAKISEAVWQSWFVPFLQTIEEHGDVVKAFSYINADWSSQPMWSLNPVFQQVDARIQVSKYISPRWIEEMNKARYLHAADKPWDELSKH